MGSQSNATQKHSSLIFYALYTLITIINESSFNNMKIIQMQQLIFLSFIGKNILDFLISDKLHPCQKIINFYLILQSLIEFQDVCLQQQIRTSISPQEKEMENYEIYAEYVQNSPFSMTHSFLYAPIIYFDPTQVLFSQNFPHFHLNTVHPHTQTVSPQAPHSPATKNVAISAQKCETEVSSPQNSQKISAQKREEEVISYVKVTNRNILPNNLNLLLSYIRRVNKSGRIVEKIIGRLHEEKKYTVKKFYSYQAYVKQQIPFHKTKRTLREITEYHDSNYRIFTFQQQTFYNKVCRILVSTFLKNNYLPTLLTSSKIHKTNKLEHLRVRRFMLLKLTDASAEQIEVYRQIQN